MVEVVSEGNGEFCEENNRYSCRKKGLKASVFWWRCGDL